jgi:precorrin-6Y C5,15-methyltransferase (decarboxylating)
MNQITVIGVDGAALPPSALEALATATLVVGGARHLDVLPVPPSARRVPLGNLDNGLSELQSSDGPAVVLASGDPGFFGIVRALRERGISPRVLPAVSSVAASFARVGLPWDDAQVVSAHGRDMRPAINACRALPKVAVLTAPGQGPAEIGAALGDLPRTFVVAESLGTDEEHVTCCSPAEAATRTWRDPNVLLVLDSGATTERGWATPARRPPTAWALPDETYEHRDGMVTKAEIRAVALARLGPGLGDLIWDIGTGSGSVAIECARHAAAVVAVDRDADQCERARRNAAAHNVSLDIRQGSAPDCLADLPDPDAVFVGGGGPDVVAACAARGPRSVVVALAAIDRVAPTLERLDEAGYTVDAVQLQASRVRPLPDGGLRLAALNPVFILAGARDEAAGQRQ